MNTIKYDIIVTKPAFDIKEGVFYDRIEGFVIKIGKKEKDDFTIRDVVIYESNGGNQDNVIIANSGKMVVTPDKQSSSSSSVGSRYQEKANGGLYNSQLVRMSFDTYKKVMDLSSFRMNKTDDSTFKHNFQMLTLFQLGRSIDSIHKINAAYIAQAAKKVDNNMKFSDYLDSAAWDKMEKDTAYPKFLLTKAYVTDRSVRSGRRQGVSAIRSTKPRPFAIRLSPMPPKRPRRHRRLHRVIPRPRRSMAPPSVTPAARQQPEPHPVIPVPGGQAVNRLAVLNSRPRFNSKTSSPTRSASRHGTRQHGRQQRQGRRRSAGHVIR